MRYISKDIIETLSKEELTDHLVFEKSDQKAKAVEEVAKKWTMGQREWAMISSQFMIFFEDRMERNAKMQKWSLNRKSDTPTLY